MRFILSLSLIVSSLSYAAEPVRLIYDTDIGNDIDDALALSLIHELADRGEVELLGVGISKDNAWSAVYTDVINTFYGRPDIPIGRVEKGMAPGDHKFVRQVSERSVNGKLVYPRDVTPETKLLTATVMYRKILSEQPDHSVVISTVGFLTNLTRLLASAPDEYSTLSGVELVRQKVRLCTAMVGAYSAVRKPEYNAYVDADATRVFFAQWPTEIWVSGYEVGLSILYPASSIERDFAYVGNHPVAEAYRLYIEMPYDRPTWDLNAVLQGIRPERGYYGLSDPGTITLDEANITVHRPREGGKHRYQTVTPEQRIQIKELFVQLVSSPPGK